MPNKHSQRELLRQREAGILPHIDIAGTDFTIDWRLRQLRESQAPWNIIDLRDMEMASGGDEYYFLYDEKSHQEYHFNKSVTRMPDNVVFVFIPYELKLDPYAAGRDYTDDLKAFIKTFPIQENLSATVKPLSETSITDLIAENKSRFAGQNEHNDLSR